MLPERMNLIDLMMHDLLIYVDKRVVRMNSIVYYRIHLHHHSNVYTVEKRYSQVYKFYNIVKEICKKKKMNNQLPEFPRKYSISLFCNGISHIQERQQGFQALFNYSIDNRVLHQSLENLLVDTTLRNKIISDIKMQHGIVQYQKQMRMLEAAIPKIEQICQPINLNQIGIGFDIEWMSRELTTIFQALDLSKSQLVDYYESFERFVNDNHLDISYFRIVNACVVSSFFLFYVTSLVSQLENPTPVSFITHVPHVLENLRSTNSSCTLFHNISTATIPEALSETIVLYNDFTTSLSEVQQVRCIKAVAVVQEPFNLSHKDPWLHSGLSLSTNNLDQFIKFVSGAIFVMFFHYFLKEEKDTIKITSSLDLDKNENNTNKEKRIIIKKTMKIKARKIEKNKQIKNCCNKEKQNSTPLPLKPLKLLELNKTKSKESYYFTPLPLKQDLKRNFIILASPMKNNQRRIIIKKAPRTKPESELEPKPTSKPLPATTTTTTVFKIKSMQHVNYYLIRAFVFMLCILASTKSQLFRYYLLNLSKSRQTVLKALFRTICMMRIKKD